MVPRNYREIAEKNILEEFQSIEEFYPGVYILNINNIDIEIIPYDRTPNPRNPFDRLTPEERRKKIVEIYAQIYLKMVREKQQSNSNLNES